MNSKFVENMQQQLKRLLDQLKELEELKGELDASEYDSMKKETLEQIQAFEKGLQDYKTGDLTLLDQIKKAQLQIQNAVKSSFNTEEIKKGFNQTESQNLREKIQTVERDFSLAKLDKSTYLKQKLGLLNQLQDLKADLTSEEKSFLDEHTGKSNFVDAKDTAITGKGKDLIKEADKQLTANKLK